MIVNCSFADDDNGACLKPAWFADVESGGMFCENHHPAGAVRTLPDYRCCPSRVVVVGLNPPRVSIDARHYYQGSTGREMWGQLERVGLLARARYGEEDEAFVAAGHGLTDLSKIPADRKQELDARRTQDVMRRDIACLRDKLNTWSPGLVVFRFQDPGHALLGAAFNPPILQGPTRQWRTGPSGLFNRSPTFLLTSPGCPLDIRAAAEAQLRKLLIDIGIGD